MSLTLQDLQDIVAICEEGSFRKAAARLGISQPTLSGRIAHTESRLGAVLFDRSRGRSRPTRLAEIIAQQSNGPLAHLGGLTHQARNLAEGKLGLVRLGSGPIPAFGMLQQLLLRIDAEMPRATMVVHSGGAQQLLSQLRDGEIDLAFCTCDPDLTTPEIHAEALLSENAAAIVSPRHPIAGADSISLADVFQHHVALPVLDPRYEKLVRATTQADPSALPGAVFCSNLWLLFALVATGRYVTVTTPFCFPDALSRGELVQVPLEEPVVHRICLYQNKWSLPLPAVEKTVSILREQCRTIQNEIDWRSSRSA